jgi:hypothetical protein
MDLIKFATLKGRVAQLDRAPDYGSGGWGFDSSLVHSLKAPDLLAPEFFYFCSISSNLVFK